LETLVKKLLYVLALLPLLTTANPIDDRCSQHVLAGAPQVKQEGNNQYLCRMGYAVNYNYATKVPYFVVEHITANHLGGVESRKDDFREDPEIPVAHRATLHDYVSSGYDRGHMAPAGDFTYDTKVMSESFLLSNMMPQVPGNNRGIWRMLEEYTRALVKNHGEIFIISGTIYHPPVKTIGAGVGIPTKIYKIIIDPKASKTLAFLMPNENLDPKKLPTYVVPVSEIESETGINFLPKLPAKLSSMRTVKGDMSHW